MQSVVYNGRAAGLELLAMLAWHVGDVVRKLREQRGWNQKLLAEKAGVNKATVVRVEAGRDIKVPTIVKIAKALNVSIATIYDLVPATGRAGTPEQDDGQIAAQPGRRDVKSLKQKRGA